MLSISGKNWIEESINKRLIEKIKIDHNLEDIIAKIIISRNFSESEIFSMNNNIEISNPFTRNSDFLKFHKILDKSLSNNEKIVIIGDYDVDGCVSTSLFVDFFNHLKVNYNYYIPNRFKDGYGASLKLIKNLIKLKPNLIIMLDCGSNSHDTINYLNKNNVKILVIDHHEIYKPYPNANLIINPKKECDYFKYDYLSTAVLTYFFLDLYIKKNKIQTNLKNNLIYVLLSIISDVMPLRKINRILALNILKNFNIDTNFLFREIFKIKAIKRKLEVDDLGFLVGPLINSAGRLDDPNIIVDLLTSNNISKKKKFLNKLFLLNEKRKKIEQDFFKKIPLKQFNDENILIFSDNFLHEGIIGIIASRLKDYYNKPAIVLTKVGNFFKGSARSIPDFNIGLYIKEAIDEEILINGGGHNLAAGFTINSNNISKFKDYLNSKFSKKKKLNNENYISRISLSAINKKFYEYLGMIAPFGENNSNPIFLLENVRIIKPTLIKNTYVSFFVKSRAGKTISGISFNLLNSEISKNLLYNKSLMSLIVQIKENCWNNKKNIQLIVLDIIKKPNIS